MSADASRALRRDGRLAGVVYLVVVLAGMFCLAWVPSRLGSAQGPASAWAGAAAQVGVFRAGIAAFALMQVAFLMLPLTLYRVLGDVDRHAAVSMVALASVSVPIGMVALMHRMEALSLLEGAGMQAAESVQAAYALCTQRYGYCLRVANLFWGLWLLPFGYLVLRSGRLPRLLGVLLVLGGLGYALQFFGALVPGFAESAFVRHANTPAGLGEIGSCLWLLAFGARAGRAGAPQPDSTEDFA